MRKVKRWILATREAVNLVVRGYALLQREMIHYSISSMWTDEGSRSKSRYASRLSDRDSGVMLESVR